MWARLSSQINIFRGPLRNIIPKSLGWSTVPKKMYKCLCGISTKRTWVCFLLAYLKKEVVCNYSPMQKFKLECSLLVVADRCFPSSLVHLKKYPQKATFPVFSLARKPFFWRWCDKFLCKLSRKNGGFRQRLFPREWGFDWGNIFSQSNNLVICFYIYH